MEQLKVKLEQNNKSVAKERRRILTRLDELIFDAEQTTAKLKEIKSDEQKVDEELVGYVLRGQDKFKRIVNLNKDYYHTLSK